MILKWSGNIRISRARVLLLPLPTSPASVVMPPLPESASVEDVDAQRDEWTYVVFFAALLHDVAKIMTDLRIRWRSPGMDEPLRWLAIAGSLPVVVGTHRGVQAEYLVEFTAKAERDYSSHGKLAMVLLQQIAPSHCPFCDFHWIRCLPTPSSTPLKWWGGLKSNRVGAASRKSRQNRKSGQGRGL